MKKYFSIIRCTACLVAISLLAGCAGNSTSSSEEPNEKVFTETFTETIPGEEPEYTTSTIYDYYDDQYTTNPGKWNTSGGKQKTVQNLSSYSFDESKYYDAVYSGGSDVRTERYLRGVGITAYHETEGWAISEATKAIDSSYLKELNVNSRRTWGEAIASELSNSYSYISNLGAASVTGIPLFADGSTNGASAIFSGLDIVKNISNYWTDRLSSSAIRKQNKLVLLGNEYRAHYKNASGAYTLSGYDDATLNDFRHNWCASRFKTVSNLNKMCGTNFKSFNTVYPTQQNPLLWYEFWLFQRATFYNVMKETVTKINKSYSDISWGYAGICDDNDPFGNYLNLDFLDYTSQNLYYNWYNDFDKYIFQLDNLTGWSDTAPVILTEVGFVNGTTNESKADAARKYKQTLNMFYMRPRVVGSYIYNYTCAEADYILGNNTWGLVTNDRQKTPAFDAVAEVYTNFKYLDDIYTGTSNTPLVAISNMATSTRFGGSTKSVTGIADILYSQGVPIKVISSDEYSDVQNLGVAKLIYNDNIIYENPDGSEDVGTALVNYMKNGGKVLRTNNVLPEKLYKTGSDFVDSSISKLSGKYNNLTYKALSTNQTDEIWSLLGDFIHSDFISGNVKAENATINENAVRILETNGYNNNGIYNPTLDIHTQMVYKNGEMYLCVVNEGENLIDNIDITIGVNNGVLCNLTPRLMRGDGAVSVDRPERANVPSYIENIEDCKVSLGTVHISNLDTYAYIYLGKAILK